MTALGAAFALWLGGAALAWLARGRRAGVPLAVATTVLGAVALAVAASAALGGATATFQSPGAGVFGPFALRLDPLAGVFLPAIAAVGALGALFAPAYLAAHDDGPGAAHTPVNVAAHLALFELLLATMALVVTAASTLLLLAAWEATTLASWALVAGDHHDRAVRNAGLGYLVAGQFSGGALALLFVLLAQLTGGWLLPAAPGALTATAAIPTGVLVLLAILGFGTKAAVAPLHVWLPDAHAAAPSHVSALMSGVLVTLGFYGLARFLPLLAPVPRGWILALMALGALGACGGVVMALGQRDVKRVLAYSTIENAGLVTLGIGAALLAGAAGRPLVAALAWSAALLHVWNHALAKSLLFLSAGAIARAVGSRDLERWGGLLRRLPLAGGTLLVGAAALAALPGTTVFAGEWLLLLALFQGGLAFAGPERLVMLLAVGAVAFAAGMALACFVRVAGIGLLGHPRSPDAAAARPPKGAGLGAALVLPALACLALTAALLPMLGLIGHAVAQLAPGAPLATVRALAAPLPWLVLLPVGAALAHVAWRAWIVRARPVRTGPAWDCGYARPDARMQYSAASLAQPVTGVLQPVLRTTVRFDAPGGPWPADMEWEARTPERAVAELYRPAFERVTTMLGWFSRLQKGRVMVYLRYVGIALLVLLAWFFWPEGGPR